MDKATMVVLVAAALSGSPALAFAQECRPDCREGYVCIDGACVSACNPPCPASEQCTADRRCAPAAPSVETYDMVAEPPLGDTVWFGHAGGGYAGVSAEPENNHYLDGVGPQIALGLGVRQPLTRVIGVQGRFQIVGGLGVEAGETGGWAGATLDGTLRIGPVSRPFPWLIGFGGYVGTLYVDATYTAVDDLSRPLPADGARDDRVLGAFGGVVETGFSFGVANPIEIVAQLYLGPRAGASFTTYAALGLDVAFAF